MQGDVVMCFQKFNAQQNHKKAHISDYVYVRIKIKEVGTSSVQKERRMMVHYARFNRPRKILAAKFLYIQDPCGQEQNNKKSRMYHIP